MPVSEEKSSGDESVSYEEESDDKKSEESEIEVNDE